MASNISNILAGARKTIEKAKGFTVNGEKAAPSSRRPAPAREDSHAPYSLVGAIKKATGNVPPTGEDVAAGLKARREMQEKALPEKQ